LSFAFLIDENQLRVLGCVGGGFGGVGVFLLYLSVNSRSAAAILAALASYQVFIDLGASLWLWRSRFARRR